MGQLQTCPSRDKNGNPAGTAPRPTFLHTPQKPYVEAAAFGLDGADPPEDRLQPPLHVAARQPARHRGVRPAEMARSGPGPAPAPPQTQQALPLSRVLSRPVPRVPPRPRPVPLTRAAVPPPSRRCSTRTSRHFRVRRPKRSATSGCAAQSAPPVAQSLTQRAGIAGNFKSRCPQESRIVPVRVVFNLVC